MSRRYCFEFFRKSLMVMVMVMLAFVALASYNWRKGFNDEQYVLERPLSKELEVKNDPKKIVIWTPFFGNRKVWNAIFKRIILGKCEERCIISLDPKSIQTADAVLFNAMDLQRSKKNPNVLLPTLVRNPNQIYVFYSMEPPSRLDHSKFRRFGSYFNWTMTYRKDSDVVEVFGLVRKRESPKTRSQIRLVTQEELQRKKMLVWMTSNCLKDNISYRDIFIQNLTRYENIDILGRCGKVCDDGAVFGIYGKDVGFSECERNLANYAFYLALENTFCDDYVTEKIYKAWILGVVPIVMGAANYSSFAPPNSYIDVNNFKTTEELAVYLKKVASDANLYNEYFEWQMYYDVEVGNPYNPLTCNLCKQLHSQSPPYRENKSYSDIEDWFFNQSHCKYGY